MTRRAVVVEDERLPRKDLCEMLAERGVEVVAEAASVDAAVDAIAGHAPDLVFLDVQLGKGSGFDVLERTDGAFDLVFVTAYDQYAVRAFELNAVDYLLKPVDPDRLDEALARLPDSPKLRDHPTPRAPLGSFPLSDGDRLFVRGERNWRFVQISDVRAIEAAGDYTVLRLADGESLKMSTTMKEWAARLPSGSFLRIHRSTIVNLGHVDKVDEWFNRTYLVHVRGIERPYTMSRRYATKIKR